MRLEPQLRQRLESSLAQDRDRRVLEWVMAWYADPSRRRWYDPFHVLYSTCFALDLIAAENADPLIVPAMLLHDIGYATLTGKEAWREANSRITHMQEGAAIAARVLAEQRYSPAEIETVVGMVAVHDNPYLGIPLHGAVRQQMRDCDRAWVMHPFSFYKDWAAKADDDPNSDLAFFLGVRRVHLFGPPDDLQAQAWGITPAVLERGQSRVETPFSDFARAHIDAQFHRRRQELRAWSGAADDPMFSSLAAFEARLRQIVGEE